MAIRTARYIVFAIAAWCGLALAHHSTANFDMTKKVTITGTATAFDFMNPHSLIKLDVRDDRGEIRHYSVFATSRSVLIRYGWRPESIRAGDTITVNGALDREDATHMYLLKIKFADGKEWGRDEIAQ